MSLRERMRLEEIEGESLLNKPQWFVKEEENEVEVIEAVEEVLGEVKKAPLSK